MRQNGDLPVYPCEFEYINSNRSDATGLTKRELFAAMAMQGHITDDGNSFPADLVALWSVQCADALLAALEQKP